jgi:cephalosporin-C deacetylase
MVSAVSRKPRLVPAPFVHSYPFDPAYGYSPAELLLVGWPPCPPGFEMFWRERRRATIGFDPRPRLLPSPLTHPKWLVNEVEYHSTDGFLIGGWLLVPRGQEVVRGLVVGHGYGGSDGPDFDVPVEGAAVLFPCFRGVAKSAHPTISPDPNWHVLHNIDKRDDYILGGCVEDLWLAVSALLALHPQIAGHMGYSGISFGGGIGALAIPWEPRIGRGFLEVPTFGNHPLRVTLPSLGSVAAVQVYRQAHPAILDVLAYYDAAVAARFIKVPMMVAAALFDPYVPPPGQFSLYNAIPERKTLFTLDAGHFDYPSQQQQAAALRARLAEFFADL